MPKLTMIGIINQLKKEYEDILKSGMTSFSEEQHLKSLIQGIELTKTRLLEKW